jgi:hypothetical protein
VPIFLEASTMAAQIARLVFEAIEIWLVRPSGVNTSRAAPCANWSLRLSYGIEIRRSPELLA